MTNLKDRELDARIAVIDGWKPAAMPAHPTAYNDAKDVPRYSSSLLLSTLLHQ